MVSSSDLIDELETQEKKGFFKSLRKRTREVERFQPTHEQIINNISFHVQNALKLTGDFKVLDKVDNIVVAGTGVNASAGDLLKGFIDNEFRVKVVRDYHLPDVSKNTLVFILSFTGNDEEAILCYRTALRIGCHVVGITSGGRLLEAMTKGGKEHIRIPAKIIESTALPYLLFPMIGVLQNSKLIRDKSEDIEESIKALKKPELKEMGQQLYEKLQDKIPILYTSSDMFAVARYFSYQLNMNARIPAFAGQYPDAASSINMFIKDLWDFYAVFVTDEKDSKEIKKSIKVAKKIIRNKSYSTTEINIKGNSKLARLLSVAHVANYTSYFLGEYYRLDENLLDKYRTDYKSTI